ncbi:MAG: ABC-type transport auxiliary lipoprotein family protein [Myxococcota bacterium]
MRCGRPPLRRGLWLLALALPAASGCVSGPAPQDHFYRLEVGAPQATPGRRLAGTVEVGRFRSDALMGGRPLLHRETSAAPEIGRYAYHSWSDPPTIMVQTELSSFLRAAQVADTVVTPEVRVKPDYVIGGRILRFERVLENSPGHVVVELELNVRRAGKGDLLVHRTYREERTPDGKGVRQAVLAFDQALTAIFQRFLADLPS